MKQVVDNDLKFFVDDRNVFFPDLSDEALGLYHRQVAIPGNVALGHSLTAALAQRMASENRKVFGTSSCPYRRLGKWAQVGSEMKSLRER